MAIDFVDNQRTHKLTGSTSSISATLPTVSEGNLLLAYVYSEGGLSSGPAGWTRVLGDITDNHTLWTAVYTSGIDTEWDTSWTNFGVVDVLSFDGNGLVEWPAEADFGLDYQSLQSGDIWEVVLNPGFDWIAGGATSGDIVAYFHTAYNAVSISGIPDGSWEESISDPGSDAPTKQLASFIRQGGSSYHAENTDAVITITQEFGSGQVGNPAGVWAFIPSYLPGLTGQWEAEATEGEPFSWPIPILAAYEGDYSFFVSDGPEWAAVIDGELVSVDDGHTEGTYDITISSDVDSNADEKLIRVVVLPGSVVAPVITSQTYVEGVVGASFFYEITATNSPTSYLVYLEGALEIPPGTAVTGDDENQIAGIPTTVGEYTCGIYATNAGGSDSETLVIVIREVVVTDILPAYQYTADWKSPALTESITDWTDWLWSDSELITTTGLFDVSGQVWAFEDSSTGDPYVIRRNVTHAIRTNTEGAAATFQVVPSGDVSFKFRWGDGSQYLDSETTFANQESIQEILNRWQPTGKHGPNHIIVDASLNLVSYTTFPAGLGALIPVAIPLSIVSVSGGSCVLTTIQAGVDEVIAKVYDIADGAEVGSINIKQHGNVGAGMINMATTSDAVVVLSPREITNTHLPS